MLFAFLALTYPGYQRFFLALFGQGRTPETAQEKPGTRGSLDLAQLLPEELTKRNVWLRNPA